MNLIHYPRSIDEKLDNYPLKTIKPLVDNPNMNSFITEDSELLTLEQYIDHPNHVPIQLETSARLPPKKTDNRCYGGIRCRWQNRIPVGQFLRLSLPQISSDYFASVQVIWRRLVGADYELGLVFLDAQQAYQMRMLEQVCHISCYQSWIFEHEGRLLDSEQAAIEWISKFAERFPKAVA